MPAYGRRRGGGGGGGGGGHEFVEVVPDYDDAEDGVAYIRVADLTVWIRGFTVVAAADAYIERSDDIPTAADATYLGVLSVVPGQATADTTFRLFYYDTNFEAVRYDSRTIAAYTTLANHGALRDLFGYATTQDGGWLAADTSLGEGLYADEAAALAYLNGKQGDADFYVGAILYRDVREWIYFNEAENLLKRLILHAAVAGGQTPAMVQFGGGGGGASNSVVQTVIDREVRGEQLFHSDALPTANQAGNQSPIDLTWTPDDAAVSVDDDEIHMPDVRPSYAFGVLVEAEVDGVLAGSVIVPWGGAGQYFSGGLTYGLQALRLSDNQLVMVGSGGQVQSGRPSPWNGTWELAITGGATTIPANTVVKGYVARAVATQQTTTSQWSGDRLNPRESIDAAHPDALGSDDVGTIFNINGQLEECVRMVHVEPAVPATWNTWADGDDVSAYWPDLSGPIIYRGVHNRGTDVGVPVDGNVYVVGGTGQWEFYQPTTGGVFGPIHGWVNVRDPNGWINRVDLHNQDDADSYATRVGNVALWGGAVHNCLTLEIPDASSISYPLVPYRRLTNPPVLEFWGAVQTSRNAPLHADNAYTFSNIRERALFNTTPAALLFGATADMVQWRTADQVTDEDITNLEVVPDGHYFAPSPGVWNLSVFYGANSSVQTASLRLLKVVSGIDNVILLHGIPFTTPAVGLGDPDYDGFASLRYDYLKVEDGDVFNVFLEGTPPLSTAWALLLEKVA